MRDSVSKEVDGFPEDDTGSGPLIPQLSEHTLTHTQTCIKKKRKKEAAVGCDTRGNLAVSALEVEASEG